VNSLSNCWIRLGRVLAFIEGEPILAALLQDLRREATQTIEQLEAADAEVRAALAKLWSGCGAEVELRLQDVDDDALWAYGQLNTYVSRLERRRTITLSAQAYQADKDTEELISAFEHWWQYAKGIGCNQVESLPNQFPEIDKLLERIASKQKHVDRWLDVTRRALAWPAHERLVANARVMNPVPPNDEDRKAWSRFLLDTEFADKIGMAEFQQLGVGDDQEVGDVYAEIRNDAKLLHEELHLRLGLSRSRLALVERYAARCEAFEAERLRRCCDTEPENAERLLTLDFARYLFDAGMPPLVEPTVGGLRPDILHVSSSSPFYVEAKQYQDSHLAQESEGHMPKSGEPGVDLERSIQSERHSWSYFVELGHGSSFHRLFATKDSASIQL
jgi:hypothetical protein